MVIVATAEDNARKARLEAAEARSRFEAFQAQLEEAKANGTMHLLPPPAPVEDEYDDRVPCPHCGRKFNSTAAERHIPKCTSIRAKPKTLMRGMPAGGPNRASGGRTPTQYVL